MLIDWDINVQPAPSIPPIFSAISTPTTPIVTSDNTPKLDKASKTLTHSLASLLVKYTVAKRNLYLYENLY